MSQHYRNEREGADRLENLAELINAAATFVAERDAQPPGEAEEADDVTAFLAHAALEAGEHQAEAGADALQLMTVHSAKGLEFHAVFISGLEEGLFPHENSLTEADGMEEERRLMYVALTRARRRLYLTFAQSRMLHGQTRYNVAFTVLPGNPGPLMRKMQPARSAQARRQTAYLEARYSGPASRDVVHSSIMARSDPGLPWRIGQSVVHPKFGSGVIVNAEGRGADARVQVNFRTPD